MNNPAKRYWFPRKRYGWGWGIPATWQGWAVIAVYLAAIAAMAWRFPPHLQLTEFLVGVFALSLGMIGVCWWKGEPPGGFHWGD